MKRMIAMMTLMVMMKVTLMVMEVIRDYDDEK